VAIPENFKQSLIVARQLPAFIQDEDSYQTFIRFVEAYYEWLENSYQLYDRSKNLLNYKDIDSTLDEFEQYFYNEFLQYFPTESLTNKKELVKLSKEFYQRKGTESSFKFLFRALYNSECDVFNTRKFMLIASSGKWIISKSIKINTLDDRFLNINNYKIVGETSKSIAKVERSQYSGNKIEIYLSDIDREFSSGEYIRVVDNNYNDIVVDGTTLRAKIIGLIPSIIIDDNFRGLNYQTGDPVIIYGGLNPDITDPVEAKAEVGEVTNGSISTITILNGGTGYSLYPNTTINFIGDGTGANAQVTGIDNTAPTLISYVPLDTIAPMESVVLSGTYPFSGGSANANTTLVDALSASSFTTYPISEITVISGGTNYSTAPTAEITSYINSGGIQQTVQALGICSPISITYPGYNYSNGDIIVLSGGSGIGAYANVKLVDANGSILQTQYTVDANNLFPYGGFGYTSSDLPTVSTISSNNKIFSYSTDTVSNANTNILYFSGTANVKIGMYVYGNNIIYDRTLNYFKSNTKVVGVGVNNVIISRNLTRQTNIGDSYEFDGTSLLEVDSVLGESASVGVSVDKIGQIVSLTLLNSGEDYVEQPTATLKVLNLVVSNVNELNLPKNGDMIYQGDAIVPSFLAYVYSITKVPYEFTDIYYLRIYNYNGSLDINDDLFIDQTVANSKEITLYIDTTYNKFSYNNGIKYYGDGKARANVTFISGTVTGQGQYLNSDGFPSSYCKLQGEIYNDFTYILNVEKALITFQNVVNNILHPAGTKMISRNVLKSNTEMYANTTSYESDVLNLLNYVYPTTYAEMLLETAFNHDSLTTEYQEILTTESGSELYFLIDNTPDSNYFNEKNILYPFATNKVYFRDLNSGLSGISLDGVAFANDTISLNSNHNENVCSKITFVDSANSVVYLEDSIILKYANVAYGYANANSVLIANLTSRFDLLNNGKYKNTNYLMDIVFDNDYVTIGANTHKISTVDYNNFILYTANTLETYGNNSNPQLITIVRNFRANNIKIKYNTDYLALIDEANNSFITDESNTDIYIPL
jgi:hypothetical protein